MRILPQSLLYTCSKKRPKGKTTLDNTGAKNNRGMATNSWYLRSLGRGAALWQLLKPSPAKKSSCAPGLAVKLGARKFSRAKRLLGSNNGDSRMKTSKSDSQMPHEEGELTAAIFLTGGGMVLHAVAVVYCTLPPSRSLPTFVSVLDASMSRLQTVPSMRMLQARCTVKFAAVTQARGCWWWWQWHC